MKRNLRADLGPRSFLHVELRTAVALPMNRLRTVLIRQRVDVYLVRHHECRIESQAEMTDNLILVCLVLILLDKVC